MSRISMRKHYCSTPMDVLHFDAQAHIVLLRKHNESLQREEIYSDVSSKVASWIPQYRRWGPDELNKDKPIAFYFMNECPTHWKYGSDKINRSYVMSIAQRWKGCFATVLHAKMFHGKI